MCANFIAVVTRKSKMMKSYCEIIKKGKSIWEI